MRIVGVGFLHQNLVGIKRRAAGCTTQATRAPHPPHRTCPRRAGTAASGSPIGIRRYSWCWRPGCAHHAVRRGQCGSFLPPKTGAVARRISLTPVPVLISLAFSLPSPLADALLNRAVTFSSCARGWVFCRVAIGISARRDVGLDVGAADRHMRVGLSVSSRSHRHYETSGPFWTSCARIWPTVERGEPNRNDPRSLRRSTRCGQHLWRILDPRTAAHVRRTE